MPHPHDVCPRTGLTRLHAGGAWRALAALPGRTTYGMPRWAGNRPTIPRGQWRPTSLRQFRVPILDQGETNSCVGHAGAKAFRRSWLKSGQQDHSFNPFWVYGWINGGQDKGAAVGDAVDAMARYGVATDEDLAHRLWFPQQLLSDQLAAVRQKATARRVLEAWHLRGYDLFDQIGSALTLGYVVVSGIVVGNNFGDLDAERVAPLPDVARGGHALEHNGLVRLSDGSWGVDTDNSWGVNWGADGTCVLVEGHWGAAYGDAFAILADSTDPADAVAEDWPAAA